MKVFLMQNGQPVEIKRSSELNVKLSKKEEKQLKQLRKYQSGSFSFELEDPYKAFKDKLKAQIKSKNGK